MATQMIEQIMGMPLPGGENPIFDDESIFDSTKKTGDDGHVRSFSEIFSDMCLKEYENLDHDHDHDHDHHHLHIQESQESSTPSSPYTLSPCSSLSSDFSQHETVVPYPHHTRRDSISSWNDSEHSWISNDVESSEDVEFWHSRRSYPPPISCIGINGKPWVWLRSDRQDGRFILTEVRVPNQESLRTCRQNGRLKMHFVHSDEEEEDEGSSMAEDEA